MVVLVNLCKREKIELRILYNEWTQICLTFEHGAMSSCNGKKFFFVYKDNSVTTSNETNQQSHFHAMYEIRYISPIRFFRIT